MKHKGFTLSETLIIGALFGVFVLAGTLLVSAERARTRDMKRIADMTRISAGFALLYAQKASYTDAAIGCSAVGADAATCDLDDVMSNMGALRDPGSFSYTVQRVPDVSGYGVQFRLERTYGALAAGTHVLTNSGIR